MDNFEKRLKQDAQAVNADVGPELRSRIDASLQGIEPVRPVAPTAHSPNKLWWVSSLTGLTAALAIIMFLNLNQDESVVVPSDDSLADRQTVPDRAEEWPLLPPLLDIQAADFAGPLEEELLKLQSDLEKARNSVREDVDFTF